MDLQGYGQYSYGVQLPGYEDSSEPAWMSEVSRIHDFSFEYGERQGANATAINGSEKFKYVRDLIEEIVFPGLRERSNGWAIRSYIAMKYQPVFENRTIRVRESCDTSITMSEEYALIEALARAELCLSGEDKEKSERLFSKRIFLASTLDGVLQPEDIKTPGEIHLLDILQIARNEGIQAAATKWNSMSIQERCDARSVDLSQHINFQHAASVRTEIISELLEERAQSFKELGAFILDLEFLMLLEPPSQHLASIRKRTVDRLFIQNSECLFQPIKENRIKDAAEYWESLPFECRDALLQETEPCPPGTVPSEKRELLRRFIFSRLKIIAGIDSEARKHYISSLYHFIDEDRDQVRGLHMLMIDQALTMLIEGNIDWKLFHISDDFFRAILEGRPSLQGELRDKYRLLSPDSIEYLKDFQRSHRVHMRRMNIPCPLDRLPESTEVRSTTFMPYHFNHVGSLWMGLQEGVNIKDLHRFMADAIGAGVVRESLDGPWSRDVIELLNFALGWGPNQAHRDYIRHVLQYFTKKINQRVEAANGDREQLDVIYNELWRVLFIDLVGAARRSIDRQVQTARYIWRTQCVDPTPTTLNNQVITWLAAKREEIANQVILEHVVRADPYADHASMLAAYKHRLSREFGLSQTLQSVSFQVNEPGVAEIRRRFHELYNPETIVNMIAEESNKLADNVCPAFKTMREFLGQRITNIREHGEDISPAVAALYLQEMGIINLPGLRPLKVLPSYLT